MTSADSMASQRRRAQPPSGGNELRRLGRGSAANLVGAAVAGLTTFALTVAVTRGVSKENAGLFFAATSLFILAAAIGQLGTPTGLVYFLSRNRAWGTVERIHGYVRTAAWPVFAVAGLTCVAVFVLAEPFAGLLAAGHVDETAAILRALALFVPAASVGTFYLSATRGMGTMRPSVLLDQMLRPGLQLALVLVAALWLGAAGLPWAWALPYLPFAILAVLAWRRLVATVPKPAEPIDRKAVRREFWRFTAPRALASVGQVVMQRLDIILVAAISGPIQAAVYTAATRFLVVGQMVNRALSTAVQPRLGEQLARGAVDATNTLYRTSTAWLMMLVWPAVLTCIMYADTVLSVFGPGYTDGRPVLLVLSFAWLFASGCGMVDMVLNMAGRTMWNLVNVALAVGINLGLDLWLIPIHGILGAAIGWAAAIVVTNALALTQIAVSLGLHPVGRGPIIIGAAAPLCFVGLALLARPFVGMSLAAQAGVWAASVVVYGVVVLVFRRPLQLRALLALRSRQRPVKPTA